MLHTEFLLRELIRESLLTEAAATAEDAIGNGLTLHIERSGDDPLVIELHDENGFLMGEIFAGPPRKSSKKCVPRTRDGKKMSPAWEVKWSSAREDGLGPLLYDIAMEASAILGASLTSDRDQVSAPAGRVWDYYATRRSDVVMGILDDEFNTLTPSIPDDNCDQTMSKQVAYRKGDEDKWHEESLSRAFTVEPGNYPNIRAFRSAGRLKIEGYPAKIFRK